MRKYLLLIVLAIFCMAVTPMPPERMYNSGESDLYGVGRLKFVNQIESKQVCDGSTPDWGAGNIVENFEKADSEFCTADWMDTGDANFNTYSTGTTFPYGQSRVLANTLKETDTDAVYGSTNSVQDVAYICFVAEWPDFDSNDEAVAGVIVEDSAGGDIEFVQANENADSDNDVFLGCGGDSAEYFVQAAGTKYAYELYIALDQPGDSAWLKSWEWNGGSWVAETELGGDSDGMVEHTPCDPGNNITRIGSTLYSTGEPSGKVLYLDRIMWSSSSCAAKMGFE